MNNRNMRYRFWRWGLSVGLAVGIAGVDVACGVAEEVLNETAENAKAVSFEGDGEAERLRVENARLREEIMRLKKKLAELELDAAATTGKGVEVVRVPVQEPKIWVERIEKKVDQESRTEAGEGEEGEAGSGTGADRSEKTDERVQVTERIELPVDRGSRARHAMQLRARLGVPKSAGNLEGSKNLRERGGRVDWVIAAAGSGGIYERVTEARLLCDAGEYVLPVVSYDSVRRMSGRPGKRLRRDDETVVLGLDRAVLREIAEKRSGVAGGGGASGGGAWLSLGRVKLDLGGRPLQAFRAFEMNLRLSE